MSEMNINPKRLPEEDFEKVAAALKDFYYERPDEYGLMQRAQADYDEYAELIAKYAEKENKILDLGSGTWKIPDTLAKYGYEKVVGLDYFSKEKLNEYSRQLTQPNAELVAYESDNIPFPDAHFDIVSSLTVFEHIIYLDNLLNDIDRVLKPGGRVIISAPNWSGVNVTFTAMKHTLLKHDRFWLYEKFIDAFFGFFRTFAWYFEVLFSRTPKFIMIYPKMKNGKIDFQRWDDDVVHLCQPLSFKKYFRRKGYKIIFYNRGAGHTLYSKFFNYIFPSFATTNVIVAKKALGIHSQAGA